MAVAHQVAARPAPAPPPPAHLAPPAVFAAACATAAAKASYPLGKTLALGFTAGALIGFGALLTTCVGGASPALAAANPGLCSFLKGAVGLPVGLFMVVVTGAELYTGNVFVMLSGLLNGKVGAGDLAKNWAASWTANLVGSLFLAWLAFAAKTALAGSAATAAVGIATAKATLPFGVAVARGILCNWLVCLGVWGAMSSNSTMGKAIAIWLPISTFITLGFEHSVANMFLIPHGMLYGADISVSQFLLGNILPVTLGNTIGAALFVAGVHHLAYGGSK